MQIGGLITTLPSWIVFILVLLLSLLASEVGAFIARYQVDHGEKEPEPPIAAIVGSMLGLLAFLLGFTFSMTASRFSERKNVIVEEANSIGTTYLRTSYMPERQREATRKLLREYVELRLKLLTPEDLEKYMPRIDKVLDLLWEQTASLDKEDMDSEIRSLCIQSMNETIDLNTTRKTIVLVFRIPDAIWTDLFLLAFMGMFAMGYQTGTFGKQRLLSMPLLAGSFALVIVMIADMDSTGRGHFRVSQQPMIELLDKMKKDIH